MAIILIASPIKKEKLTQCIYSLNFYLKETDFKIVYCDNSNEKIDLQSLYRTNDFEFLTFDGNKEKSKGNGFGEYEIIKYSFSNSSFIKNSNDDERIIVLTENIIIKNINNLNKINYHNNEIYYFRKNNMNDFVITFAPKKFWDYFIEIYKNEISDNTASYIFENVLYDTAISYNESKFHLFNRPLPIFEGITDTLQTTYGLKHNDDLEIFVNTHENFSIPSNETYIPICDNQKDIEGMINASTFDNIAYKDQSYSELIALYWLWKNYNIPKYIGLCHYRKYFDFMNNIPNIENVFNSHDIILPSPQKMIGNIAGQYAYYHNIKDLIAINEIISKNYGADSGYTFAKVMNNDILFPCNMFIMKKNDFINYCNILFNILFDYDKMFNLYSSNDYINHVNNNSKAYLKDFEPNSTSFYQSRIPGFLSERIFTWFITMHFKNPQYYNIELTKIKYSSE